MHRSVLLVAIASFGLVAGCGPSSEPSAPSLSPTPAVAIPAAAMGLVNEVAEVAVAADGAVWAATGEGVLRWQTPTSQPEVFVERDGLPSRTIDFVAASTDGSVWAAGNRWVAHYDGQWEVLDGLPGGSGDIGDLAVARDGTPWVALGDDLLRLVGQRWVPVDPPPVTGAWPWTGSLAVAPDGVVWASPNTQGDAGEVLAYDGSWRKYSESDGLAGQTSTVVVSGDGTVWVGGDGRYGMSGEVLAPASGVSRLAGGAWRVFTTKDGLVADDADVVAGADGTVWAVSAEVAPKGIARFDGSTWTAFPDLGGRGRGAAVDAAGTLWMPSDSGVIGFDGTDTTRLVVTPEQTPPQEALPGFTLTPAKGVEPLRTSTSIGDLEWTTYEFPPNVEMFTMLGTAHGPVAAGFGNKQLWWSTDNVTWAGTTTMIEPWRLARAGQDVVALRPSPGGGAVRFVWDGAAWVPAATLDINNVHRMAFGPKGAVAAEGTTYSYAPDAKHFTKAKSGPNRGVLTGRDPRCGSLSESASAVPGPLLATSTGFVALTASNPEHWNRESTCSPVVWTSPDGDVWTLVSPESPFGAGSAVDSIAERDGRFVAVGTAGVLSGSPIPVARAWTSTDGIEWEVANLDLGDAQRLDTVSSGPLGWIITGPGPSRPTQMWTSPDGMAWAGPYPLPTGLGSRPGWFPPELAIGTDSIFGAGGPSPILVVARLVG